ncbi:type IV fimbrial biogenesis protein FimT [Psychrobacter sp. JCM 18901]|uniref:GspH/FimT family pseudopilin n=1 Tax=Psychrobacter sp. JCM 18901 TaxID=1298609 RepID=UPI0004369ACB|nr:GspH/FimT family pseudopilin [Psychrobacter sp. JCM 18901]GAF56316.1 type IV fimbrial biogenesis protein FimT [Psychrobacter sp. JCM 18901]
MILLSKILAHYKRIAIFTLCLPICKNGRYGIDNLLAIASRLFNKLLKFVIYRKPLLQNDNILNAKQSNGFTLVELTVTTMVLGIIAAIAAPSILTHLARMEAQRVKHQLENTLSLAKAESYISRQDVLVCLSNDAQQCHRNSDKTLLLFVDKNNNKHFDSQVDTLLTQQSLNLRYSTVKLRVGGRRHYTKFWGDSGRPRGHFGHIKYCPTSSYNKSMYQISFNQSGIVKHKLNVDHPTKCNG